MGAPQKIGGEWGKLGRRKSVRDGDGWSYFVENKVLIAGMFWGLGMRVFAVGRGAGKLIRRGWLSMFGGNVDALGALTLAFSREIFVSKKYRDGPKLASDG